MSEVKVRITDELGGSETITKNVANSPTASIKEKQVAADTGQQAVSLKASKNLAIATMLAKQSFNYATSNIGKWTGNSHNQAMVNNLTDMFGIGMLAYINPAVAVGTLAFRIGTTAIDEVWSRRQSQYASERALARAGFNSKGEAIGYRRNK